MHLVKVAAAALNTTPLDWDNNQANILGAIHEAKAEGVSILCLPELCISGYGCEDVFHSRGLQEMAQRVLLEILPETRDIIVSLGLPVLHSGGLYDAACLVADGQILGLACKQNLAGEGIHYEPRWFKPWPQGARAETTIGENNYPLGDLIFDCGGVLLGFEICEDAWVANRPGSDLSLEGVDVMLNPSASHFAFGKQEIRRRFVLEGSRAQCVSYIYANLLGNEAGRAIYDGGTLIASAGKMLVEGRRFSYKNYVLTAAVVDIDATRMARARTGSAKPDVDRHAREPVRCPFQYPKIQPESAATNLPDWESGPAVKEEEFTRAVALALLDYLRKSRSSGFVVSLSGGADSAAVATLVALVVKFAHSEIGLEAFVEKLSYITRLGRAKGSGLDQATGETDLVRRLLTCVYQSTRNSSETTQKAAGHLAEALGARFLQFDVDALVQSYVSMVSDGLSRQLNWQDDDIALQNIQARARAPGVWMLANLDGSLLLSTSNRSEAAVGYATMDGDTSGGLAPIAGIDKAFLQHWLRWMQDQGPSGIGSVQALELINQQQPTAELRPLEAGQTDEVDLMPYKVLDAIERAAIRDKHVPLDVLKIIQVQFPNDTRAQLGQWVDRFFRLWTRNQWKRERYAPSFHLDDENLDPKTWCRFPILSGGFQRELAELKKYLENPA